MNRIKASILVGALAVTLTVAGCAKNGALGGKVATIDGTVITKAEYDKVYNEIIKNFGMDKVPEDQRASLLPMIQQMTLNKLTLQVLIHNEAKRDGLEVSDQEVQAYKKKNIFDNPQLKDQFKLFLTQNNMTEAEFDAMLEENLLLDKFMDKKGGKEVQISDAEVKAIYDKNVAQFKVPESYKASHILVKAVVPEMKKELREKNAKISDAELDQTILAKRKELQKKAEDLYNQVKANPDKFAELAKAHSDDTASARNGGELGDMMENTTDPDFWAALKKTPVGKMHPGLVSTVYGYHIVRVAAHNQAHQQTFAEAKEMIRERMSQAKKQEFLRKWAEQRKNEAKIVIEPAYMPKPMPAPTDEAEGAASMQQPAAEAGKH